MVAPTRPLQQASMSSSAATSRPSPAWCPTPYVSTTPGGMPTTPPSAGQMTASYFASGIFPSRSMDEPSSSSYFDLDAARNPSSSGPQFFQSSRDREFAFNLPPSVGVGAGSSSTSMSNTPRPGGLERRISGRPGLGGRNDGDDTHGGSRNSGITSSPDPNQRTHFRPTNPSLSEGSQMSSGSSTPTGPPNPPRPIHHSSAPLPASNQSESPLSLNRAHSTPVDVDLGSIKFIPAQECLDILKHHKSDTLLLDVRPLLQYNRSHITGSLNLCIPTTLLKRTSFNLQKVADTFASGQDKAHFNRWRTCTRIIVHDSSTTHPKDASLLVNLLRKFAREGWEGEALILSGGFTGFAAEFPDWVERTQQPAASTQGDLGKSPLSISLTLPTVSSIAGGCAMPTPSSNMLNPFFSNIRQNVDLIGGVGQLPVNLPPHMKESTRSSLPRWLARVADSADGGKTAALQFLNLEKCEQSRMQQALTGSGMPAPSGQPAPPNKRGVQIAGIEKGSKNRYNNIYPYDHCRVKIQDTSDNACDYINASFIRPSRSNKRYIATQAPMPSTFNDFWRVVWEQDIRLIVMLTAEIDGAQVKCHRYWQSANYNDLKVQLVSEGTIPLHRNDALEVSDDTLSFKIRHCSVTNSKEPFQPPREVIQLQYADWPDFGAPAKPFHLLRLIEECDHIAHPPETRSASKIGMPASSGQRKVLVHCSAGCGRTGTFCTVDSVIDMLKRQAKAAQTPARTEPSWVYDDQTDLVAATVEDFRSQRLSMVQNLRQFVLCYESILEWLASDNTL